MIEHNLFLLKMNFSRLNRISNLNLGNVLIDTVETPVGNKEKQKNDLEQLLTFGSDDKSNTLQSEFNVSIQRLAILKIFQTTYCLF